VVDSDIASDLRAYARETSRLLWAGRWDVVKAGGLYAVFMAFVFGVFAVQVELFPEDDGAGNWLDKVATAFLGAAFVFPPFVLLHALGSKVCGRAVPFHESVRTTIMRLPKLIVFGLYAAVFSLSWLFVLYLAAGFLLVIPTILAITLGSEPFLTELTFAPMVIYGALSIIGLLAAIAILIRTAALAPLYILVDGLSVFEAWQRSNKAMSWRAMPSLLPWTAPCMAYALWPVFFLSMYFLPGAIWVPLFMASVFLLPSVCLSLALTGPLLHWHASNVKPNDPVPETAHAALPTSP